MRNYSGRYYSGNRFTSKWARLDEFKLFDWLKKLFKNKNAPVA